MAVIRSLIPEIEISDKEKRRIKTVIAYNKKHKNKSMSLEDYRKKYKI